MVTMGAKRPSRNLCRTCWSVETRSSNTRLISALNEMTRRMDGKRRAEGAEDEREPASSSGTRKRGGRAGETRHKATADEVVDRRHDPDRPHWHL
ncbi:MAG TPA: hypothetical protein VMN78_06485 [Longimicrobiales bacterium]|nr:hypothetical protein [Longimicrobiales bacterium]